MNKVNCMNEEKISIIIPVYNIEHLLDSTLTSVINQTYKNIEIILIDDGSSDGSGRICDKWERLDSRVKSFHKKNEGVSSARNWGFSKSSGNYILFIDGDDEISPEMCEKLLSKILFDDSDMSYCGYENIFSDQSFQVIPDEKSINNRELMQALMKDPAFFTSVWNKLFKRQSLLDSNNEFISFQEGVHVGEDELWLSKVLKNVKKASAVNEVLYFWKRRENSATHGGTFIRTDQRFLTILDAYRGVTMEMSDDTFKQLSCKKYLGVSRDCMIQAYSENNPVLANRLRVKIISDKKMYSKTDMFLVKLNLCLLLVKINAPLKIIKKIQNM